MEESSVRQVMARPGRAAAACTGVMLALHLVLAPLLRGAEASANPATIRHREYVIQQEGKALWVTGQDLGLEAIALAEGTRKLRHYVYRGPWQRDAWYNAEGRLILLSYAKHGAPIRMLLASDRVETGGPAPVVTDP